MKTLPVFGGHFEATQMQETNQSSESLLNNLQNDGYIYLRNFIPKSKILAAQDLILEDLKSNNFVKKDTLNEISSNLSPNLLERLDLIHSKVINNVVFHEPLVRVVSKLIEKVHEKPYKNAPPPHPKYPWILSVPYKWLRAVGKGLCTGPHLDKVYLGKGSKKILTLWIPLVDISHEMGALCVAKGSHKDPQFESFRRDYGEKPISGGKEDGWVKVDDLSKYGIKSIEWKTSSFEIGDVVIFGLDLLHTTAINTSDSWRISIETRWQPASDPYPPF